MELHYQPTPTAEPVLVQRETDLTRIIVPMQGVYAPVPSWVWVSFGQWGWVLGALWFVVVLVVDACLRRPKPPRAVFEIGPETVSLTLRNRRTGEVCTTPWPRGAVLDARQNRFSRGLWLNIAGHTKDTYLADCSPLTIQWLEAALQDALGLGAPASAGPSQ
ncbi:MAG: hypothetical protein ACTHM6_05020 [Tepidisphaeraceae bacterium]